MCVRVCELLCGGATREGGRRGNKKAAGLNIFFVVVLIADDGLCSGCNLMPVDSGVAPLNSVGVHTISLPVS